MEATTGETPTHTIGLDPTVHSVRAARQFAASLLGDYATEVRDTVVLLVSELVSNAVEHGGPHDSTATVGLEVDPHPAGVVVKVSDAGGGEPRPGNGAVNQPSGRGLRLVDKLASRWGCHRRAAGKTVWFEILTPTGADTT